MKELIAKVVSGEDLSRAEAAKAMDCMLGGDAEPSQIAGFLTALRMKGETVEEIIGCTQAMKAKAGKVNPSAAEFIDFVGTGGDAADTFNVSTTASIVTAAAGVVIAKHGNRAASSKSGSADLLESLGVSIMLEPEQVEECINDIGIGFMMAQKFHKAMKNVAGVRKELGIRTIFNMLGPLSNPSGAKEQVIGVFSVDMVPIFARVMKDMGVTRAMVICGEDGMDEITVTGKTYVNEIKDGEIIEYEIDPVKYGIPYAEAETIKGGDGAENARITMSILKGEKSPRRDIVVLNAAAGIYIGGKASSYTEAVKIAEETIDSGKAFAKLEEFIKKTRELAS